MVDAPKKYRRYSFVDKVFTSSLRENFSRTVSDTRAIRGQTAGKQFRDHSGERFILIMNYN